MVKQVKSRRAPATRTPEFTVRELWLASLGAASLTRKQGIKLYAGMIDEGRGLQTRITDTVASVTEQVNGAVVTVRERIDAVVTPARERVEAIYIVIKDEVETRLQPVLSRFGVTAKRASAKRIVRKSSKTAVTRKRVVRRKAA